MFLDLLPLALGAALYPTLLAMVVLIVRGPNPTRMLSAYLLGAMVVSVGVGVAIVRSLDAGNVVGGGDDTVGPGIDIALGLFALVVAFILATGRDRGLRDRRERRKATHERPEKDPWSRRVLARESVLLTFAVGMALSLPGALYLAALKDIAAADHSPATELALVVWFNLVMFVLAELPFLGYLLSPERTEGRVFALNQWMSAHARQIAVVLAGTAAVFLLSRGLADLFG
jgi:hypothetical protein